MDNDQVMSLQEKMGDFAVTTLKAFKLSSMNILALISNDELNMCRANIATCVDEMAEIIIETNK